MQSVLEQVNGVPEVIGSLVCAADGRLLGHLFPPIFDADTAERTAAVIASAPLPLRASSGEGGIVDLRFRDGRVIMRQLEGGTLLVLCTVSVNLSLLTIALNVAATKLNHLFAGGSGEGTVAGTEAAESLVLKAVRLDSNAASRGFDELGMVGVNHATAREIAALSGSGSVKKIVLSRAEGGTAAATFPVMLINDESGRYAGAVILSPATEKKLGIAAGASLVVTAAG